MGITQPQSNHTSLELTDEPSSDLRERRLDVVEVGRGRHKVRHLGDRPFTYDVHKIFGPIIYPSPSRADLNLNVPYYQDFESF